MTTNVKITMLCPDGSGLNLSADVDDSLQKEVAGLVVKLARSQRREKQ